MQLLSEEIKFEVLALDAWILASGVDILATTQVSKHLVVALLNTFSLYLAHKRRIDIVTLLRLGSYDDALEGYLCCIPTWLGQAVIGQSLLLGSLLRLVLAGAFGFELFHRGSRRLDDNKERTLADLDVFGEHGSAGHEPLQFESDAVVDFDVAQRSKKVESLLDTINERLFVEVSDIKIHQVIYNLTIYNLQYNFARQK